MLCDHLKNFIMEILNACKRKAYSDRNPPFPVPIALLQQLSIYDQYPCIYTSIFYSHYDYFITNLRYYKILPPKFTEHIYNR